MIKKTFFSLLTILFPRQNRKEMYQMCRYPFLGSLTQQVVRCSKWETSDGDTSRAQWSVILTPCAKRCWSGRLVPHSRPFILSLFLLFSEFVWHLADVINASSSLLLFPILFILCRNNGLAALTVQNKSKLRYWGTQVFTTVQYCWTICVQVTPPFLYLMRRGALKGWVENVRLLVSVE